MTASSPPADSSRSDKAASAASFESQSARAMAHRVARMLFEIDAVLLRPDAPFTLASGRLSPVYVDCRRVLSFPRVRSAIADAMVAAIDHALGMECVDSVAGGETAGIPFAALVAERMGLPMIYVRKKPKGHGRNARIEGVLTPRQRVLLIEDLATDGGSKIAFAQALREAGATCTETAVIFHYGLFPAGDAALAEAGLRLIGLCNWRQMIETARREALFDDATLGAVESFIADPAAWQAAHPGS